MMKLNCKRIDLPYTPGEEIFTDHAVTVYGSLKKGLKTANIEG